MSEIVRMVAPFPVNGDRMVLDVEMDANAGPFDDPWDKLYMLMANGWTVEEPPKRRGA